MKVVKLGVRSSEVVGVASRVPRAARGVVSALSLCPGGEEKTVLTEENTCV